MAGASVLARRQLDAAGDRLTAEALDVLPTSAWVVLHDVAWPGRRRATIAHVVIGPPGVFVVDTKNWSGRVTLDGGVLRQNGRSRAASVQGVEAAAGAVRAVLSGVRPDHVHAVLCLAGDEAPAGLAGDVLVCASADLASVLSARPALMSEAVASIAGEARRLLGPADAPRPEPEPEPALSAAPAPRVTVYRPVTQRPAWLPRAVALVVAGGVAIACLTQPQLVTGPADQVSDFVSDRLSGDDPSTDPLVDKPARDKKQKKADKKKAGKKKAGKQPQVKRR